MKKLIKLFMSQHEMYLDPNHQYDPQQYPKRLIAQLDTQNPDNVLSDFLYRLQNFKKGSTSGLQAMHKLTSISLLILHSDKFYQTLTSILPLDIQKCRTQDKWLKQNFLIPYQQFLLKCCTSWQMYSKVKQKNILLLEDHLYNFDTVFYIINLLNKLFPAIEKISHLSRYYSQVGGYAAKLYTHVGALQSLRLYITLKTIVIQMVNSPQKYMPSRKQQKIMKTILGQYIIEINQNMKNILLNKYYAPYRQGIKTKLFRNQQQQGDTFKTINGILNSHRDTQRQNQKKKKQQTIIEITNIMNQSIDSSGSKQFNPKIAEFSINMSNMSQTLTQISILALGSPLKPRKNMLNAVNNTNAIFKSQQIYKARKSFIVEQQHEDYDQEQEENQENLNNNTVKSDNINLQDKMYSSTETTNSPCKNMDIDSPMKKKPIIF